MRRRPRRMAMTIPLILLVIYVVYAALVFSFQGRLIFPAHMVNTRSPSLESPEGFVQLWHQSSDGSRIEAWLSLGDVRSEDSPGPAVMFFHGNAELIEHVTDLAQFYNRMGVSVLLMEYRGYGRSGGTPSQRAITQDAVSFRDLLAQRPEVDAQRIMYHGRSLGGGVACALARERPPAGLILESTFVSLASMAKRYLLPSLLCRHPFRNDQVLREFDGPVLLMHGTSDFIIPSHNSEKLHELSPNSTLVLLPGGHNDFPTDPEAYAESIKVFLGQIGAVSK